MNNCIDCKTELTNQTIKITLKVIPTGRNLPFPKYIPQFKASCIKCGRFLNFEKQSENLINNFNEKLTSIHIHPNDE